MVDLRCLSTRGSAVSTWIRETSGCVYRIPFFTEIARHLQGDRIAHGGLRTWGVHSGNRKWVVIILQSNYTHIYIEYHHLYGVLTYSKPLGRLRKCGYLEMAILIIGNMVMHQVFPILFRQTYFTHWKAHSRSTFQTQLPLYWKGGSYSRFKNLVVQW